MSDGKYDLSVVILNYNGQQWIDRCFASLRAQTAAARMEVLVADNLSTDGSDLLIENKIRGWANWRFIQHGANLGYCDGNNRAAKQARGKYLIFLNNDLWLEPDCLERLLEEMERTGAAAGNPLVLNYDDDSFQSLGATGFDCFGLTTARIQFKETREVLMPEGCAYLIRRQVFEDLGGFDPEIFMYADEYDLSWRLWIAGYSALGVPSARLHHRGAANVNPRGGGKVVEMRTSDTKRFYANRNALLVLLKNCRHLLLGMAILQLGLYLAEAAASLILVRRWSFVRRAYLDAVKDCWRLRRHIVAERTRISGLRKRGDIQMLRFLKLRMNRWDEVVRMITHGKPTVSEK